MSELLHVAPFVDRKNSPVFRRRSSYGTTDNILTRRHRCIGKRKAAEEAMRVSEDLPIGDHYRGFGYEIFFSGKEIVEIGEVL